MSSLALHAHAHCINRQSYNVMGFTLFTPYDRTWCSKLRPRRNELERLFSIQDHFR